MCCKRSRTAVYSITATCEPVVEADRIGGSGHKLNSLTVLHEPGVDFGLPTTFSWTAINMANDYDTDATELLETYGAFVVSINSSRCAAPLLTM